MNTENILEHLKALGFNSYEAKVYLSLLKHHPATGYEVSKESGVPQARAYDTLKVLETRNIVVPSGSKPITYIPINPDELLNRSERTFKSSINFLKNNLNNLSEDFVEPILNIRGEKTILKRVIDLIENAEKEIFLEIWDEDAKNIKDSLKKAHDRGIDVKVVGYNNLNLDFGLVYQHGLGEEIEKSMSGRWIVLSVDCTEGLVGVLHAKGNKTPQAVWTKNPGIVLMIKEVVVHDMYILDVEKELGDSLQSVYGKDLRNLREKILGANFQFSAH